MIEEYKTNIWGKDNPKKVDEILKEIIQHENKNDSKEVL